MRTWCIQQFHRILSFFCPMVSIIFWGCGEISIVFLVNFQASTGKKYWGKNMGPVYLMLNILFIYLDCWLGNISSNCRSTTSNVFWPHFSDAGCHMVEQHFYGSLFQRAEIVLQSSNRYPTLFTSVTRMKRYFRIVRSLKVDSWKKLNFALLNFVLLFKIHQLNY